MDNNPHKVRQTMSAFETLLKDAKRVNEKFVTLYPHIAFRDDSHDLAFYFVVISLLVCEDLGFLYSQTLGSIMAWFVVREYEKNASFALKTKKCITEINRIVRGILWFLKKDDPGSIRDLFVLTDSLDVIRPPPNLIHINITRYVSNDRMKLSDFYDFSTDQIEKDKLHPSCDLPWWVVQQWRLVLDSWPPQPRQSLITSDISDISYISYILVVHLQTLVGLCFSRLESEQIDAWASILESDCTSIGEMILAFQSSTLFVQKEDDPHSDLIRSSWNEVIRTMPCANPEAVWRRLYPCALSMRVWGVGAAAGLILLL